MLVLMFIFFKEIINSELIYHVEHKFNDLCHNYFSFYEQLIDFVVQVAGS